MIREQKDQPRGNILIIDSSQAALHLLAGILSEQGYLVRPIMNGTDVYSAIKTEPPDLILLDVNLPDINGYEICKQLKEDEQTSPIPIIFISESDGNFEKARAFAMGGADYINKPYQVEEVLARIETHLNLYKLRQQLQKEIRERGQIEQSLKQTQNDLKQRESFFQSLMDTIPSPIFYKNRAGRYTGCNKAFEQFTGRPRAEIIGKTVYDMGPSEIADEYYRMDEALFQNLGTQKYEWKVRAENGGMRDVIYNKAVLVDASGQVNGLVGVIWDITETKHALQVSRQMLQTVLDTIPVRVFWKDINLNYMGCNQPFAQDGGLASPQEIIGMNDFELSWVEQAELYRTDDLQVIQSETPKINYEEVQTDLTGTRRWLRTSKIPLRDIDGSIIGILGTYEDITDYKRAEEALQQANLVVENSPVVLFLWRAAEGWPVAMVSQNVTQFGYTPEELLSGAVPFATIVHPEDLERVEMEVAEYTANGIDRFQQEYRIITKDGRVRWLDDRTTVERNEDGHIAFYQGIALDITERKQNERIIQLRLSLMGFAATHSLAELLQKTLDEVGELTGSPIGFFHFVEADQKNLTLQAWSTRTLEEFCQTEGKGLHYSIGQAGVWADSVREQRAIIHNDYEALPHRKGFPEGHAQVVRELIVPILRNGRTVAILGIGNKSHDYTEQDAEFVSYIADLVWEITEQKRAAEALKQSELLLGNSQRIAHIGSWDMDTKTQQIIWTDEAYRIFGYRPQEFPVSLEFFINSLHPDDCSMVSDHFSEMLLTKQFREVDYRTVWPDGTMRWIHATGKVYTDENGEPVRIIGTVQDITERREAEKALHLTRFSVDNVADAVYWIDAESQITDANETASRMLGYTYEELMQMSLSDIDLDFSIERWAGIWQHLKDESKRTIEAQHRTKDDRIIPVEIVSNYIKFNGRELACAVVRDITERKQAEETLQKNEEHLRLITENMVDVISQTDAQINIIYSSPSLERVFGYLPEVIIGKPAMGMIHPDDVEPVLKLAVEARQRGETSVLLEYRWRHADGDYLWVESATRLLYDEHGESLGAIFGTRDITDRKRAEAEQMKLEEQLRQAQKLESIGRLAGGIAHDFNNLLVPMMGYTELGQMKLPADHSVNDYLQKIGLAAERAANLTRQILAFSRRQMLEIQLFDLNEIIIEFREMLHRLIGEDIELQLFLASSACLVKADQTQIEQILLNLCVNARDAMPNGGRLIIETDNIYLDEAYAESHLETQPGNYIMLSISDTGQGMDNETQKQIFEPFFTTKERGKGTGLGLATVFGVVKQHKGNIWVYSEPDKGTTFKIYLPRAKSNVQPDEISTSELPTIYGTETVMIAEDEPMVRKLAHETLEAYGYTVIETESVAEALDIAATYEDEIHLLLTDVIMPGMNGRELYEKLKKRRPDLIVLYMSGYTDNVIVHHGVLDEGVNFLQKPFTIRGLAKKVRSVLD